MATRHYSPKSFFRNAPNALLARFFQEQQGLLLDLDFAALSETRPDGLFTAWQGLPETVRNPLDILFQSIFALSCDKGIQAIIDEADWQLRADPAAFAAFKETLSGLPNHYHRALTTYLDHPEWWKGATYFHHADSLPYWRKRKNLGHNPAAVDDASLDQLADKIGDYFHRTEGRGKNCKVECLRRNDLDYFFAFPEDYSRQGVEWVKGTFDRRPHNPAFEIVFVYSQQDGTLDLNYRGTSKAIEHLQWLFATLILKLDEAPENPKDRRVYDLNPLRQRGFAFVYDPNSGIEGVAVKKLRLSSRAVQGERITVEADPDLGEEGIYDLLAEMGRALPLEQYNVTQVDLAVAVTLDPEKPPKTLTVSLTHPNFCSLKYDGVDIRLRQMLTASGIEPQEPKESGEGSGMGDEG